MWGEAAIGAATLALYEGLSPRVRGSRVCVLRFPCRLRVYPRVCGEAHREGASPRHCRGSIPACAGKPGTRDGTRTLTWVYPRVCGEASRCTRASSERPGLSPRVRGSRDVLARDEGNDGSIPACAGKPSRTRCHSDSVGVYPRVCGEAATADGSHDVRAGLSPRVRGSPHKARN